MRSRQPKAPTPSEPTWDQMARELAEVGVPDEQARLYVNLVRRGASSAGELAQALHLSRPQTYRLLDALAAQGFITATLGRPRLYTPGTPTTVLRALRHRSERALAHLDRVQDLLAARLDALRKQADLSEAGPHFTVVRGTDALSSAAQQVVRGAAERIDVMVGQHRLQGMMDTVVHHDLLAQKAKEGVDVRLLLPTQAGPVAGSAVKRRDLDDKAMATLLLADGRDALMVIDGTPMSKARDALLGLRTNALPFVATQGVLFEHLWDAAPRAKDARRA